MSQSSDCRMQRIDVRPTSYDDILEQTSKIYEPPKALFDVTGRVLICEKFGVTAYGSLETLYDPLQHNKSDSQQSQNQLSHFESSTSQFESLLTINSSEQTSSDIGDPKEYIGRNDVSLSQFRLDLDIPSTLYIYIYYYNYFYQTSL